MSQAQMKVGKFGLSIQAKEPTILPPCKGSTLRSGFGNAFRRFFLLLCPVKGRGGQKGGRKFIGEEKDHFHNPIGAC